MNKKDKYIEDVNKRFTGKAKEIILNQIELFFKKTKNINKEKYKINDDVILEEGTFIHGIPGDIDNFDFVIENGFISVDFTESPKENKIYKTKVTKLLYMQFRRKSNILRRNYDIPKVFNK